ncbi:MAG: hypothetical protein IK045_00125 [Bacteroidales bacterium]|nr:hypothetical protein [Bacteroidales bacterium]
MIKIHLYSLASPLHSEVIRSAAGDRFIKDIAALGKVEFVFHDDFSLWGTSPGCEVLYIRTGGTEGLFLKTFFSSVIPSAPTVIPSAPTVIPSEVEESPSSAPAVIPSPEGARESLRFTLLTSGESNSLAASMEILSFLRLRGIPGEILHGTPTDVAAALAALNEEQISPRASLGRNDILVAPVAGASRLLEGVRLGVVGRPSDWLISSDVDYAKASGQFGVEIIDVPMEELLDEIRVGGFSIPDAIRLNPLNVPRFGAPFAAGDFDKALEVYGALSRIVKKYGLQGLTVRCFDLLGTVGTTGCMALAILNAEGITATCEGDVPAMVTMAIANKLAGTSGFQVNLSRIRDGRYLFAHCTVPLDIVKSYCYDRHFESGIGVAVHGEFAEGPVTIFKVGAGMDRFFVAEAILESNPYDKNLCRTQVVLRTSADLAAYFLREPLGNHHVIIPGRHAAAIRDFVEGK